MKFLILNLPDTPRHVIQRDWAGTFGTATSKEKHHGGRFLPVYMLYMASAMMNSKQDFRIIDGQGLDLDNDKTVSEVKREKPDIIISLLCIPSYNNDLAILNRIKEELPETKIICLGGLVNVTIDKTLNESKVDFLIKGRHPFYNNIIEIIQNLDHIEQSKGIAYKNNGQIIKNQALEDTNDLNNINFEAYKLIDLNKYKMMGIDKDGNIIEEIPILTAVGCPYGCIYCAYPVGFGEKFIYKDVDMVIDEIEYVVKNFSINGFCMRDIVFTQKRAKVIEICNKIMERNLKIKFVFETRANLVDKEMLEILKKAGCYKINFGLESGNAEILKNVGKPGINKEVFKKAFRLTSEAGIMNMAHIILGLPGENKDTIKETYDFLKELKADSASFNFLTPYPGTKLYDLAVSKGWIKTDDWSQYSSHNVVMGNDELSVEDLKEIGGKTSRKYVMHKLLSDGKYRKLWLKRRL